MTTILLLCLSAGWVSASLLRRRVKPLPGELGRMTEGLPLIAVGLAACAFLTIIAAAMLHWESKQSPIAAAFALLSAGLVHLGCMPCLRWNESGFTYRSALGLTRRFTWQDGIYLTDSGLDFILHAGKCRIALPKYNADCTAFLREIKKHRRLELRRGAG